MEIKMRVVDPHTKEAWAHELSEGNGWSHYFISDPHKNRFSGVLGSGLRELWTGRLDSKGAEIYENDEVSNHMGVGIVCWKHCAWAIYRDPDKNGDNWGYFSLGTTNSNDLTVIGREAG